jgi:uncharacterized protein YceH (UPF0502 family)
MNTRLDPVETRVLGSLVEKELTTPDAYPLSLAALTAACNQKSNRDPVMSLDEATVQDVVHALMKKHQVREQGSAGGRVSKYAHRLSSSLDDAAVLSRPQLAVMAVLMLRGPQTVGELRTRTTRMYDFDSLAAVEHTLLELATREPEAYVAELPRQPGQREQRFMHLLGGDAPPPATVMPRAQGGDDERLAALEAEVAALRAEVTELRDQLRALLR